MMRAGTVLHELKMHSIGRFLKRMFGSHRRPHVSWAAALNSAQSGAFPMNLLFTWVEGITKVLVRVMRGRGKSFRTKLGGIYSNHWSVDFVRLLHVLPLKWQTEFQSCKKRKVKLLLLVYCYLSNWISDRRNYPDCHLTLMTCRF
jgi:hypothetical protein